MVYLRVFYLQLVQIILSFLNFVEIVTEYCNSSYSFRCWVKPSSTFRFVQSLLVRNGAPASLVLESPGSLVLIHPSTRVFAIMILYWRPTAPKIQVMIYDSIQAYEQSWWIACECILSKGYMKGKGKGRGQGKGPGKGKGKGFEEGTA